MPLPVPHGWPGLFWSIFTFPRRRTAPATGMPGARPVGPNVKMGSLPFTLIAAMRTGLRVANSKRSVPWPV